jgi:hypothetical protein
MTTSTSPRAVLVTSASSGIASATAKYGHSPTPPTDGAAALSIITTNC